MLARYIVLRELGRGALGPVCAARDRTTGAVIALKSLDPALSSADPGLAGRFLKQTLAARRLVHRNIVRIHDAGEMDGTPYVAMEMLEGRNLRSILDDGPLPIARAIQIAHDIASALAYAHLEGVVHGGLRPSNVILLASGAVKITDFGIGQLGQAAPACPEAARGDAVDHRCDLFALGALLYEMLTRQAPAVDREPLAPSELNPHVPRALEDMAERLLAQQPEDRLPGAPIVLRELERLASGLGIALGASGESSEPKASVTPDPIEPITDREAFDYRQAMALMDREAGMERSPGRRSGTLGVIAVVLAVLALGLGAGMYYSSGGDEPRIAAAPKPAAPKQEEEAKATEAPAAPAPAPAPAPVAEAPKAEPPKDPAPLPKIERPVAQKSPPATRRAEKAAEQKAAEKQPAVRMARLILTVSPQGQIYIDGKYEGTAPPMTTFDLEPGMHRIEVRSGSRRPYLTYMTLQPGDVRHVRHDFNAKPIRPPA